jgi:DNA-binding response OmpR family regulator
LYRFAGKSGIKNLLPPPLRRFPDFRKNSGDPLFRRRQIAGRQNFFVLQFPFSGLYYAQMRAEPQRDGRAFASAPHRAPCLRKRAAQGRPTWVMIREKGGMTKILVVEDEANIRELITYNLATEGYELITAEDGKEGIVAAQTDRPDLILLDLMLPSIDGYGVIRALRNAGNPVPVIMLTAKNDEVDKVLGLEFGADDYMTKPFGVRELKARIRAVLRRYGNGAATQADAPQPEHKPNDRAVSDPDAAVRGTRGETIDDGKADGDAAEDPETGNTSKVRDAERAESTDKQTETRTAPHETVLDIGDLRIDIPGHEVTVAGTPVTLTLKEFELLRALAENRGIVLTRDRLLDKIWGYDYAGETRTVDVHVRYLRRKLGGGEDAYIMTVRGVGYKMR